MLSQLECDTVPPFVVCTRLTAADAVRKGSKKVHLGTIDTDAIVAFDKC
jgi:hypothetical protein